MVLQQQIRVRVSVVPNIFMISLTFFRNSNGSHGTVGTTTGFWDGRSVFESLSHQRFSWFHWHFSEIPMVPMAQWVGQQGFEAVDTCSNPSLHLHFLLLRRKILILPLSSPLLSINFFAPGNLLKHSTQGFPYEIFRYCETKIFL